MDQQQPKKKRKRKPKKLALARKIAILEDAKTGKSTRKLAEDHQVARNTVHSVMNDKELRALNEAKVNQISEKIIAVSKKNALKILRSINKEDLKKANLVQKSVAGKINLEVSRLEQDKSTQNISHRGFITEVNEQKDLITKKIQELMEE